MTLVEHLLVLIVVGLALAGALAGLGTGALGSNVAVSRAEAVNLAASQMEYVGDQPFAPAPAIYPSGVVPPSGFTLSTVAEELPGGDVNVQRVLVTVTRDGRTLMVLEGLKVNRP